MTNQSTWANRMNIALWVIQLLLAATFGWSASVKLGQPVEQVAAMWPWAGQVPVWLVKATGLVDLSAALGLIIPAWLRIQPVLTPVAALGSLLLMVCASMFHINRGEAAVIGVNVVVALLAAFVAWGRLTQAPIRAA